MNLLARYLTDKAKAGLKRAESAQSFDISQSYLSELESGLKRPSLAVAFRIERRTRGEVPASSWVTGGAQ